MKKYVKLILLLGAVGISVSAPLTRFSTAPSIVLALYRMAIATLALLPVVLLKHKQELKTLPAKTALLCIMSGIFLALHFGCYLESVYRTSIAASTILTNTQVFFVAVIMLVFFREKLSKGCWLGIVLTFIGGVIIALASNSEGTTLEGNMYALASAVFMAIYSVIGRFCRQNISNSVYVFMVYGAAAVTLAVLVPVTGNVYFGYEAVNFLTAAGMVLFCTFMGHAVFSWGLKYETPSLIATVQSLEPVFATVLGIFLFGEIPGILVVIGGAVVISGVTLYCRRSAE